MTEPESIAALFEKVKDTYGRLDVLFNNAGMGAPAVQFRGPAAGAMAGGGEHQPHRAVPVHAARLPHHEGPNPARRPHHQQRLDLGTRAAAIFHGVHLDQARHHGLTKSSNLDGRDYDIAVGQVDIGNAATPMTDRMVSGPGVMQPDGKMMQEPRMDAKAVGDAVAYMAGLPLDANVLFMTVMATKMPFVGRG